MSIQISDKDAREIIQYLNEARSTYEYLQAREVRGSESQRGYLSTRNRIEQLRNNMLDELNKQ